MILTTNKGGEFEADLVMPISTDGSLMILLHDPERRPLSVVAVDFEDLSWVETDQGARYDGFGDLRILARLDDQTVQVRLYKEG